MLNFSKKIISARRAHTCARQNRVKFKNIVFFKLKKCLTFTEENVSLRALNEFLSWVFEKFEASKHILHFDSNQNSQNS